ncbi:hypothetical protein ACOSQ2_003956 [Xanthoceras sorbifolium]
MSHDTKHSYSTTTYQFEDLVARHVPLCSATVLHHPIMREMWLDTRRKHVVRFVKRNDLVEALADDLPLWMVLSIGHFKSEGMEISIK